MTLIELLIGVAIGLIVITAAIASLIVVRQSSRTMTDSAALEQQATLVMLQIGNQIGQAGATNAYLVGNDINANVDTGNGNGPAAFTFTAASDSPLIVFDIRDSGVSVNNPRVSIFGQDGADPASDTLQVSHARPNDYWPTGNCASLLTTPSLTGGAPRDVSVFTVNTTSQSLTCATDPDNALPTYDIAANVADMRLTYLYVDGSGNLTTYANAANVNGASLTPWNQIHAVQVCLELVGDPTTAPKQTYTDCRNVGHNPTDGKSNDGRLHRIVRNTFYLRNS
ncbi:MAG: PilW family protein [Burkholderiaceae bacterium]|jgi:type IV pilus assembly protein PilW|nr:PilW family protein [Burkholderiaceae bacterium]